MNLLSTAVACAIHFHTGEHFKYVDGAYYEHPKAVSERMHTTGEKVVALLHDVVENAVKKRVGRNPTPSAEEAAIQQVFHELRDFFRTRDCDLASLIPDIDILTKRVSWREGYELYIARIKAYARKNNRYIPIKVKKADLEDNSLPERNPPPTMQTQKDKDRLARYAHTLNDLNTEFPEIVLRPHVSERRKVRKWRGRRQPTRGAQRLQDLKFG